ncbi:MAG: N-acetyltransferase [Gemmatimonadales bacterium]
MTTVRPERPTDADRVRELLSLAFGGSAETEIVDRLRGSAGSISLVATEAGAVVGHVLFTAARVEGRDLRVAALGPMAVIPERQREGIGARLIAEGLAACGEAGYRAVVVVGHPSYYPRFGFRRGSSFGLRCGFEVPDEAFMALELVPSSLAGGGEVRYAPEFG